MLYDVLTLTNEEHTMVEIINSTLELPFGGLWLKDESYTYAYNPNKSTITCWGGYFTGEAYTLKHPNISFDLSAEQVIAIIDSINEMDSTDVVRTVMKTYTDQLTNTTTVLEKFNRSGRIFYRTIKETDARRFSTPFISYQDAVADFTKLIHEQL